VLHIKACGGRGTFASSAPLRETLFDPPLAGIASPRHMRRRESGRAFASANLVRSGRKQPQRIAAGRPAPLSL